MKHEAYRQRFKKWRKFINAEDVSSPLTSLPVEAGEEEEEDDDFTVDDETKIEGCIQRDLGGNGDHLADVAKELEEPTTERPGGTRDLVQSNDRRDQDSSAGGKGTTLWSRGDWTQDAPTSCPVMGISEHVGHELGRRCFGFKSRNCANTETKDDLTYSDDAFIRYIIHLLGLAPDGWLAAPGIRA
jgi:hypothetical protein